MSPDSRDQKIDPALIALRQADPQATVAAIVRTEGAAEAHRAEVVEGQVAAVIALADHPWVASVSLDREVHVMRKT